MPEDAEESNAPILFLSARTKDSDKTLGFSSGGDDYLAKPFSYNELISRAKALIRRYQVYKGKAEKVETPKNFSCKNLVVDEETKVYILMGSYWSLQIQNMRYCCCF